MRNTAAVIEQYNVWSYSISPVISDVLNPLEQPLTNGPGLRGIQPDSFFSGLIPLIEESLDNVIVEDCRTIPEHCYIDLNVPEFVNRDYQKAAVLAAVKNTRGVLTVPTGGGKTRIAAGIMGTLPCTWLYIVHRSTLVEAAAKSFSELLGEEVGIITADKCDLDKRITCATFDALAANTMADDKQALLAHVQGLIVDEAHKLPSLTALGVTALTHNAYYRIGMSATPFMREDKKDIHTIALLGPEIYSIKPETIAAQGYLVLPTVKWITARQDDVQGKWHDVYASLVTDSTPRNAAIVEALVHSEKPAIAFVKEVGHGQCLFRTLIEGKYNWPHGAKIRYLSGDNVISDRLATIQELKDGTCDVLITTNIFSEGLDVPNLKSVFNLTGESSWKEAIQRLGRGTRPDEGKESFTLYDINDVGNKWLTEHTVQRYLAYRAAGFKVAAPSANALWRAANEDKRLAPTIQKSTMLTRAQKGGVYLLAVLGPVIVFITWALTHMARGR